MAVLPVKLAIVGGGGVGKSSLTVRFVHGTYTDVYDPTIEESYMKQIFLPSGKAARIELLDTAGQEEFKLGDEHLRDRDGFLCVMSLTSAESLVDVEKTWRRLERMNSSMGVPEGRIPAVIALNKSDLPLEERQVSVEQGTAFGAKIGLPVFLTSAKTGDGVNELFMALVGEVIKKVYGKKSGCVLL